MPETEPSCDICGRPIFGKPNYKFIEGAKLQVCQSCSKFGKSAKPSIPIKPKILKQKKKLYQKKTIKDDFLLIEDFGKAIKEAREGIGMTQNEFAYKLKEPLSLVKRIEQNKFNPPVEVIKKIEHELNIKLTEKNIEEDIPKPQKKQTTNVTIGDIAQIKKKKE